nr:NlpC/P60 family protein [Streptomyces sp. KCTC 0041BP]
MIKSDAGPTLEAGPRGESIRPTRPSRAPSHHHPIGPALARSPGRATAYTPSSPAPPPPSTRPAHRPVSRGELLPGDRLFWAHRNGSIHHVGLYAGSGRVLHAPRTGCTVEVAPVDSAMPAADYGGATRPDPPKEIQGSL